MTQTPKGLTCGHCGRPIGAPDITVAFRIFVVRRMTQDGFELVSATIGLKTELTW